MPIDFPDTPANNDVFYVTVGAERRFWRYNSVTTSWKSVVPYIKTYARYGSLAAYTGSKKFSPTGNISIKEVYATVSTPSIGNTINIQLVKSGTAVANITIDAATNNSAILSANISANTSDYFTVNVLETDATGKGQDLSVVLRYITT